MENFKGSVKGSVAGNYKIEAVLGKGAYGEVFRAFALSGDHAGTTVAVKRVSLKNVTKEDLESIQMEIDLLKNLDHVNIVKYLESFKSKDYLYIILEFIEGGAIGSKAKASGGMSEDLVVKLISQVILGLKYLHEEGVIHRDIKGANILTTKDGIVKLADFGVSTTLNYVVGRDMEVAGTPLWMAPEIIEMTGLSTASDIWSVGCTVVELLTGYPPYHNLPAISAMFRIVSDDHPPLPEKISPLAKDFLINCFQKEPNLRCDANTLLLHPFLSPYMKKVREQEKKKKAKRRDITPELSIIEESDIEDGFDEPQEDISELKKYEEGEKDDMSDLDLDEMEAKANSAIRKKGPTLISAADLNYLDPAIRPFLGLDTPDGLDRYKEGELDEIGDDNDLDGFSDDFDDTTKTVTSTVDGDGIEDDGEVDLQDRLKQHLAGDWEDGDSDLFNEADFDLNENENEAHLRSQRTLEILTEIQNHGMLEDEVLKDACLELTEIFLKYPELKESLITYHGILPILELLDESKDKPELLLAVIRCVTQIVCDSPKLMEVVILLGGLPVIMRYGTQSYELNIRRESSFFIGLLSDVFDPEPRNLIESRHKAKNQLIEMFIACGGLKIFVHFLKASTAGENSLVMTAIGFLHRILFNMKCSVNRNDFCRLFARIGIFDGLVGSLARFAQIVTMRGKAWDDAVEYDKSLPADSKEDFDVFFGDVVQFLSKAVEIIVLFSQGDVFVKSMMSKSDLVQQLLEVIASLFGSERFKSESIPLLKTLKNLSMSKDPAALEALAAADTTKMLVDVWAQSDSVEVENQIVSTLFNICKVRKDLQQDLALAGAVPHLINLIDSESALRNLALPMIINMVQAGDEARRVLRDHDGITYLVHLLSVDYWGVLALQSLSEWAKLETKKVEIVLTQNESISALVEIFSSVPDRCYYNEDATGSYLATVYETAFLYCAVQEEQNKTKTSHDKMFFLLLSYKPPQMRERPLQTQSGLTVTSQQTQLESFEHLLFYQWD